MTLKAKGVSMRNPVTVTVTISPNASDTSCEEKPIPLPISWGGVPVSRWYARVGPEDIGNKIQGAGAGQGMEQVQYKVEQDQ